MNDSVKSTVNDYKYMCFDGRFRCSFTCTNRFPKGVLKVTFYDHDWNLSPFERNRPKEDNPMAKPQNYCKMIEFPEMLSSQIPFIRVDFYEVNCSIYFGELSFYPDSGYVVFQPNEWDNRVGDLMSLPV